MLQTFVCATSEIHKPAEVETKVTSIHQNSTPDLSIDT